MSDEVASLAIDTLISLSLYSATSTDPITEESITCSLTAVTLVLFEKIGDFCELMDRSTGQKRRYFTRDYNTLIVVDST